MPQATVQVWQYRLPEQKEEQVLRDLATKHGVNYEAVAKNWFAWSKTDERGSIFVSAWWGGHGYGSSPAGIPLLDHAMHEYGVFLLGEING